MKPKNTQVNKHTPKPWGITCRNGSFRIQPQAKDPTEIEANTRLVRMAPELIEALETIARGSVADAGPDGLGVVSFDYETAKEIARSTIAKLWRGK